MQGAGKKPSFLEEIQAALQTIRFGSVEIYVQDGIVTQVTVRNIKKTKYEIPRDPKTVKSK